MAHRLESIAVSACRRLGRSQTLSGASVRSYTSTSVTPMSITSSRIRPAATSTLSSNSPIFGQQCRQFHLTSIRQEGEGGGEAAAAKTDEPIAPFASPKVEALFQKIIWLDMVEVHLLAELINEKMGITISDAERERMARGGGGGGGKKQEEEAPEEVVEEKTVFDLKLMGFDAKSKIKVIKEIRAITSLGLKEAKELVEGAPTTVKKDIKKEEAEELKTKLEGLGAQIDIV